MYKPCPFCNAPVDLIPALIEARRQMTDGERAVFDFLWRRSPAAVSKIEVMERLEIAVGASSYQTLLSLLTRIRRKLPREECRILSVYGYGWKLVSDKWDRRKMLE